MNLFDSFVAEALRANSDYTSLKPVVEKEILHHDILRIMSEKGFLKNLVFIGGTCLRACYGSLRLSEDLDFTGGMNFNKLDFSHLGKSLTIGIKEKYGLDVEVLEPIRTEGNVDTWKIKVITRPESLHLPSQRINIDICSLTSFDVQPAMLINHYGVDLGSSGLLLMTESKVEIFADKIIALALRPNRIKNRDLWDILYLHKQQIKPNKQLIQKKLEERKVLYKDFTNLLHSRFSFLETNSRQSYQDYLFEMTRFLPKKELPTLNNAIYWQYLIATIKECINSI